ncbi:MAG: bifunctional adenosylcobinamide kinase/adenosylcobinamide-phosphate guanylyltransferase [Dehalococcoidales bacterium]
MAKQCILILGGARSGKSRFAMEMALQLGGKVLFVATAEALDEEMKQRIEEHKRNRPSSWRTVEVPAGVGRRIRAEVGGARVVIVDCLSLLVSNVIGQCGDDPEQISTELVQARLTNEIDELIECINGSTATFILVSNEVGMGLVPGNRLGRLYCDFLGKVNQTVAERADRVYFMLGGIPLTLKKVQGDKD